MELYKTIENDVKSAMKGGEAVKLSVLRMVLSAIRMHAIEKNVKEVADADVLQIMQRQIKQHKESIEQFEKGKRSDLADKELAELEILESYMPEKMSEDELLALIKYVIKDTGASAKTDIGKVMKLAMERAKGRADGKTINQLVADLLGKT